MTTLTHQSGLKGYDGEPVTHDKEKRTSPDDSDADKYEVVEDESLDAAAERGHLATDA